MNIPTYHARVYTSYEMESHARQRLLYAVTVRPKSLYQDVHASTSIYWYAMAPTEHYGANYTDKDAAAARGICQGCALGSAHQYPTNQHYPLSHTTLVNSSSSMPSHTTVLELQDMCSPLHRPRITPGISSLHQVEACHGAHCSHGL